MPKPTQAAIQLNVWKSASPANDEPVDAVHADTRQWMDDGAGLKNKSDECNLQIYKPPAKYSLVKIIYLGICRNYICNLQK